MTHKLKSQKSLIQTISGISSRSQQKTEARSLFETIPGISLFYNPQKIHSQAKQKASQK
jgi:hypothetical protein